MVSTSAPSGVMAPSPVTDTRALIPSPIEDPLFRDGRTDSSRTAVCESRRPFPVLTLPKRPHLGQA
ncbi:hypothetical protein Msi02_58940 [Microbispora siamensis]|uniref:Uncharacterized protein n=1 Tax=Microbispora siamensis TaxID=564413 RepID=A0ABQ4GUI1_9ACTN|nr:hypothetical protein Msi02_58940 [Microbispora siamensis]